MVAFAVAAIGMAATWYFLMARRMPLDSTDIRIVADPGLSLVFRERVQSLVEIFLTVALASLCYLVCLWALRRGFRHSFAAAIAGSTLACIALIPASPLTSPDVTHLAADVRTMWIHGRYPSVFDNVPEKVDDPVAAVVRDYKGAPSGYGPVAYGVGGIALPFVGDNPRVNIGGQKAVAGLFLVLTAAATGLVAKQLGRNPGLAAGFVGLNPLLHWEFAANGHNDSIMTAFGMLALYLVIRAVWTGEERRPWSPNYYVVGAGLLAAVGAGVAATLLSSQPFVAGILGAGLVGAAAYLVLPGSNGMGWRLAAGLAGAASVLSKFALAPAAPLVAAAQFPRLRQIVAILVALAGAAVILLLVSDRIEAAGVGPAGAVTANAWTLLWDLIGRDQLDQDWIVALAYFTFVAITLGILLLHPLDTPRDLVTAIATLMFLFLFIGYAGYRPWYQIWYLPFAILSGRRWLVVATLLFVSGGFLIILARNFAGSIASRMGIEDPIEKAVILTWSSTALVGAWLWWSDRSRQLARAAGPLRRPARLAPRRR